MVIWLRGNRDAAPERKPRVGASGDVIPREAFGALVKIDAAYAQLAADRDGSLNAAKTEAAAILAGARIEARALVAKARREYESAAERGYRAGEERALADWIGRLAEVTADQQRAQLRLRERIAGIVTVAVEQIVCVEQGSRLFERALATVERIVDGATWLRVSVSPGDHAAASVAFDALAARWRELGRAFALSMVEDARLAPGSCLCETDFGIVDASLDTQMRAMRTAVERALRHAQRDMADAAPSLEDEPPGGDPRSGGEEEGYPDDGYPPGGEDNEDNELTDPVARDAPDAFADDPDLATGHPDSSIR
jgi:type III secretion protein L